MHSTKLDARPTPRSVPPTNAKACAPAAPESDSTNPAAEVRILVGERDLAVTGQRPSYTASCWREG